MANNLSRRQALGLGLAAASVTMTSCSSRVSAQPPPRARPPKGERAATGAGAPDVAPLPFDPKGLSGLSEKLLTLHHDKNYGGAVRKLVMIRQRLATADPSDSGSYWSEYGTLKEGEAAARNSALLHELYFANLVGPGQAPSERVGRALADRFGSVEASLQRMKACGKATGGWVVLVMDAVSGTIEVVPTEGHRGGAWHAEVLIVLDVFEHSYALDYGPDKGSYLDAFFRNLNWTEIDRRFGVASRRLSGTSSVPG